MFFACKLFTYVLLMLGMSRIERRVLKTSLFGLKVIGIILFHTNAYICIYFCSSNAACRSQFMVCSFLNQAVSILVLNEIGLSTQVLFLRRNKNNTTTPTFFPFFYTLVKSLGWDSLVTLTNDI